MAEISQADDDDAQRLVDAEPVGDAAMKELHVIADTPCAEGPQMGQVLAQFGARDTAALGEFRGGDGGDPSGPEPIEGVEVDRKPLHGRRGDLVTSARGRDAKGHGETYLANLARPMADDEPPG
jgi:hypothetical protein